jgi:hypothetical protein
MASQSFLAALFGINSPSSLARIHRTNFNKIFAAKELAPLVRIRLPFHLKQHRDKNLCCFFFVPCVLASLRLCVEFRLLAALPRCVLLRQSIVLTG